jgi:hypothetical protein
MNQASGEEAAETERALVAAQEEAAAAQQKLLLLREWVARKWPIAMDAAVAGQSESPETVWPNGNTPLASDSSLPLPAARAPPPPERDTPPDRHMPLHVGGGESGRGGGRGEIGGGGVPRRERGDAGVMVGGGREEGALLPPSTPIASPATTAAVGAELPAVGLGARPSSLTSKLSKPSADSRSLCHPAMSSVCVCVCVCVGVCMCVCVCVRVRARIVGLALMRR